MGAAFRVDGGRVQRRFPPGACVAALYDFVLSRSGEAAAGRPFALAEARPGDTWPKTKLTQAVAQRACSTLCTCDAACRGGAPVAEPKTDSRERDCSYPPLQ